MLRTNDSHHLLSISLSDVTVLVSLACLCIYYLSWMIVRSYYHTGNRLGIVTLAVVAVLSVIYATTTPH